MDDLESAIFKKARIVDRKLLDSYHNLPCGACLTTYGTCGHHVKRRKSGGHDIPQNLIPLCQKHHNEVHNHGEVFMANKYPLYKSALKQIGWIYDETIKPKWLPTDERLK